MYARATSNQIKIGVFLLLSPVVAPFSHQIKYKISLQDERKIRPMARLFYVCAVHVYATKPKRTDAFHQVGFPISMQINNNNSKTISIIQMESFLLNVSSRENIFFLIWSLGFSITFGAIKKHQKKKQTNRNNNVTFLALYKVQLVSARLLRVCECESLCVRIFIASH